MKYTTLGKRFAAYRRRREQAAQPAQPIVPREIEVIELSDDVEVVELSDNTTSIVERAEEIEVHDATTTHAEEVEGLGRPDEIMLDEEGLGVGLRVNVEIPFESNESMPITTAGGTGDAQNQDNSRLNDLQTQPQSPSSSLRVRVEVEEQEIQPPGQMEGLGGIAALPTEQQTEAIHVLADGFLGDLMRLMVNEVAEKVAAESEEEEPLTEALVTEGESSDQEPLAEDTPGEDLTGERHVASAVLAPGPQLVAEVPAMIAEPIIPPDAEAVPDPIAEEAQVPPHFRQLRDSLRIYIHLCLLHLTGLVPIFTHFAQLWANLLINIRK
jgi:hypothetical protein